MYISMKVSCPSTCGGGAANNAVAVGAFTIHTIAVGALALHADAGGAKEAIVPGTGVLAIHAKGVGTKEAEVAGTGVVAIHAVAGVVAFAIHPVTAAGILAADNMI
jgi:hypothetical protein